jgi:hypothetical protein
VTSRAIGPSWVADRQCVDVDDGGQWLGGSVEEPGRAGDRGGTDWSVEEEDGRGVEAVARRLDRTGAGATGRPGRGGAQGGTGCRGGGDMEEPATPGYSWIRPLAGGLHRVEAGGCRQVGGRGRMMGQRWR